MQRIEHLKSFVIFNYEGDDLGGGRPPSTF